VTVTSTIIFITYRTENWIILNLFSTVKTTIYNTQKPLVFYKMEMPN